MHTTPDSSRLSQCPPAATTPAPGPHTSRLAALVHRRRPCPSRLGVFSAAGLATISVRRLPSPSSSTSRFLRFSMSLSTFLTFPWQNGVCGLHATPDCGPIQVSPPIGQSEPPGRLPPAPGPQVNRLAPCCHGGLRRSTSGGHFHDSRRFPDRRPPPRGW